MSDLSEEVLRDLLASTSPWEEYRLRITGGSWMQCRWCKWLKGSHALDCGYVKACEKLGITPK